MANSLQASWNAIQMIYRSGDIAIPMKDQEGQQSGNWRNDLYVAIVDDFVRALVQVSRYYQYLKDKHVGIGSRKEELMLWIIQRSTLWSRHPMALNVAMAKMHGAKEFCTREPNFEGEEVFGSQKRKADIPLGSEDKSYRLN